MAGGLVSERGASGEAAAPACRMPAIEPASSGVVAFVGRTLKGPLHRPVRIESVGEFERRFGGLWQPSTLSYAIEQFFENGGQRAIVVRVANGARPPTLSLAAGRETLHLIGVNPGSREYLRAAVDYDGIGVEERDRFNLVLQRVRAPSTEQIEEQEIYARVSIEPGSARFVADLLLESSLMRVLGPVPRERPDATPSGPGYVDCALDGSDGGVLSDYDVIGSLAHGTGLWALKSAEAFDLLCIPPLAREVDVGLATLYIAAQFCREQRAMLVIDPPADWSTPERALTAIRTWPLRSDYAVMFFPRLVTRDRLRGRAATFGSAAAAAGMLARQDRTAPAGVATRAQELLLRPGMHLAACVEDSQRLRLAQAGINTLREARRAGGAPVVHCTLAGSAAGCADWRSLAARRLANGVVSSIERALAAAAREPLDWAQARAIVEGFLERLQRAGAFAGTGPEDSYFVVCDEQVNPTDRAADGVLRLLFGIALSRPARFHAWLVTVRGTSGRARPVAVNRFATSPQLVDSEIETAILRGRGSGGHA